MKVRIKSAVDMTTTKDMKPGQIGRMWHGRESLVVLRTYTGTIDLSDPQRTWDRHADLEVKLLPPGTVVELVTEE